MAEEQMIVEELLNEQQMNGKIGLYAKVTIAPGGVLDNHEHHGESESYFILSGTGLYDDNGKKIEAKPGDTFFCEDGGNHGIACTSEQPLVFMALIIKA